MTLPFVTVSMITLAGAIGMLLFRHIVHCVLCLALVFTGIAMFYLQLQTEFLGFAQFLVYIGAVTILILFAILLTKNSGPDLQETPFSSATASGGLIGILVFGCLWWAIQRTPAVETANPNDFELTVKSIGESLMTDYVIPLEVIALLLTAAMIGAIVVAMSGGNRSLNGKHTSVPNKATRST